jgi:hypothetical protein
MTFASEPELPDNIVFSSAQQNRAAEPKRVLDSRPRIAVRIRNRSAN